MYAKLIDVEARYEGDLDPVRVLAQLDDAAVLLRRKVKDLDARIAAEPDMAEAAKIVTVRMVLRVLRNPAGFKNEQAGDYGYSIDPAVASGRLFLTRDDLELLGVGTGRVGAIKVGSGFRR